MVGFYTLFYMDVSDIIVALSDYRLFWVIDFITETSNDLLENYPQLLTERETAVCKKLANKKFPKAMKSKTANIPELKQKIAVALYELFKMCRKLTIDDKQIVLENFNLNKIEV